MIFNSIEFAIFLPVVFGIYWFLANKSLKLQNGLIVAASYLFYGWWDYRFLSLIAFSSALDYFIGLSLGRETDEAKRRIWITASLVVNLGLLGFFKYFNFFIESFANAFTWFGQTIEPTRLEIILPVGISFYTFQTLSYSIDIYRRKIEPCTEPVSFFAFVSFFPQLVAGPIERASNLLPQFHKPRVFDYGNAVDGMRQILWGLFKKVVVADGCAEYANLIFNHSEDYSGSMLLAGGLFFAFQIYGDFSGYSDIAIGVSRLFGFRLMQNFAFPYFSRSIAEFWRRWHISLSTWFRDYLYIPLGGSRVGIGSKIRNTFIIFTVSGFWHGANWTFIAWGVLNALLFLPALLIRPSSPTSSVVAQGRMFPTLREFAAMMTTFLLTVFGWIFFRARDVGHAYDMITGIFAKDTFKPLQLPHEANLVIYSVCFMMAIEWVGRENQHALEKLGLRWYRPVRWMFYMVIFMSLIVLAGEEQDFIYFQF
jgi:D-alanyl-lipoteichoic acid acyltransferase DltB (MBOAT superfamily)